MKTMDYIQSSQIVLLIFLGLLLHRLLIYIHRFFLNPISNIGGPKLAKVTDWYGAYHAALGELHLRTYENHHTYGSAVRQGPNKIVFNTVTAYHDIHNNKIKFLHKSKAYLPMLTTPGAYNIHTAIDKTLHRFKRRIVSQGLSNACMREFEPSLLQLVDKFVRNVAESVPGESSAWSSPMDMKQQCKYLGFDVMGEFGFGQSFKLLDESTNRFLIDAVAAASHGFIIYGQFPDLAKMKLEKILKPGASAMRKPLIKLVSRLLNERLEMEKAGGDKNDLFSFIVNAKDSETNKGFSQPELWAEARFLLIAGSDTTSTSLASLFFYLSRYPKCYEKVANEIRTTFASASDIHCGQKSKMNQCVYLRACIDEAMRMSPPAGGVLWREVTPGSGGVMIDNKYVPEGVEVGCSIYSIHHNEEYFPDSFVFKPERWIVSDTNTKEMVKTARDAFVTFSLGPRGCPGGALTYMEISDTMAKILWDFDFRSPLGDLGALGAGKRDGPRGRQRPLEFQLVDRVTSSHDGPYLQFKRREEVVE